MSDLPFEVADPGLAARLAAVLDEEGKIPRALEALGPLAARDVVLLDGGGGLRAGQLAALGARVTAVERGRPGSSIGAAVNGIPGVVLACGEPAATSLPGASADAVVAFWSAFRGPVAEEVAEAERLLRPGGRLLVVHDYGRDDVSRMRGSDRPEYTSWSRREGPFLRGGFKLRVIHCWWTFDSVDDAATLLRDLFGAEAEPVVAGLARPRLSYNVAVYHRTRSGGAAG